MPANCPLHRIATSAPTACLDCSYYNSESESCCWFLPGRPIVEFLDTEERLCVLEQKVKELSHAKARN